MCRALQAERAVWTAALLHWELLQLISARYAAAVLHTHKQNTTRCTMVLEVHRFNEKHRLQR
jgi:hypothetical protein